MVCDQYTVTGLLVLEFLVVKTEVLCSASTVTNY